MPEIVFKGKELVYNHHLTVPYRPLVAHADKGVGTPDLDGGSAENVQCDLVFDASWRGALAQRYFAPVEAPSTHPTLGKAS